ncbi:MAG: DMT family transporter [Bacteroidales bacterium]|nr:DMT family transporter [Bacteroidales bacterium]
MISLFVAVAWTATALFAEVGSKRMGSLTFNTMRMVLSLLFLTATLWLIMGVPYPRFADGATWGWMLLSGFVGYVLGDYCLMKGYILIGSRFGQLFMTLSAPTAAIIARLFLGEKMHPLDLLGMFITLGGIAMSILSKNETSASGRKVRLKLPLKGIFFASMAGIGQGAGLVISKIGLFHYEQSASAAGMVSGFDIPDGALLSVPICFSIPFAATLIRTYIGLSGFFLALMLFGDHGLSQLHRAVCDRKAMWSALGSTILGPFVGVSASMFAVTLTSAGIAQTIFALTPILIIAPAALFFHQRVTVREVIGAVISVLGVSLFFIR